MSGECNNINCSDCIKFINFQTGEELDWIKINKLPDNSMLKVRPDLWNQWDFKKNEELGLDIYKMTQGTHKKAWWLCELGHEWRTAIYSRVQGNNCLSCYKNKPRNRVTVKNSLINKNPELASQWHPTLNGDLTPNSVAANSSQKVWWLGSCGHEWDATINNRNCHDKGCPYCANQKILIGFNDMWTTNPELAKLLANQEDGFKYTENSGVKVNWKCSTCKEIIKNKIIGDVNRQGLSCPNCSDGFSYPEKFIYQLLKQLDVDFEYQIIFKWSKNRRYDFYLPKQNTIIEVHGLQHYEQSNRGRSIHDEQENDRLKYNIALENDIDRYVVIDCRYSKFDYIKNNVLKSELAEVFDLNDINWSSIIIDSLKSINIEMLNLWNSGYTTKEISNQLKISTTTIVNVLKNYSRINMCDFKYRKKVKRVYQLDTDFNVIKIWDSAKEIESELGIKSCSISLCCNGKQLTSHGYAWLYEEDYIKKSVNNK